MSKQGRMNHLVAALQDSGFYPEGLSLPGAYTIGVRDAIEEFLGAPKGKNVQRVVNAFRTVSAGNFRGVGSVDYVTAGVREATEAFLEKHNKLLKAPPANEIRTMKEWELRGGIV